MHKPARNTAIIIVSGIFIFLISAAAQACHTPARAAILGQKYADPNFVKMAHDAHMNQPLIPYEFKGAQTCQSGTAGVFGCLNIDLVGHLSLNDIGGGSGSDSWGWKDEASNRYFALVGRSNGTAFVEITDPANPVYIGNLPTQAGTNVWRDIKTRDNFAFIVADNVGNHGMQVFDLTNLLTVSNPPATFTADTVYTNFGSAHNIVLNPDSGFAYAVGSNTCSGGLHMINIKNPLSPTSAGCFSNDGYTHDAQCVNYTGPDPDHQGKEICFASNEDTLTIVDVTNKATPVLLSRTGNIPSNSFEFEYIHQGWLTEDQRYFLIDDELDERRQNLNTRTFVLDVNDLDNPVITGFHEANGAAIDHNQYIVNGHAYQANYTRGLRILRVDDPATASMEEVAFFDTFPAADSNQSFSGAWNVYPFFDNGLVMISDINRGVFIVRPNLPEVVDPDVVFSNSFE